MEVAITAKIKNGVLWRAVEACGGNQSELARYLGLNPSELGELLNFKAVPSFHTPKWQAVNDRLLCLTGETLEDAFPFDVIEAIKGKRIANKYTAIREVPVDRLIAAGFGPKALPTPEDLVIESETPSLQASVVAALNSLTSEREREIIKMRFGIEYDREHTLEEIGERYGVTTERIRQIEAKALRHLRQPRCSRTLRQFVRY